MGYLRNHRPISLVHRACQKSVLSLGCGSVQNLSFVPRPSLEQGREEVDTLHTSPQAESPERLGVGVISDTPGQRVEGGQERACLMLERREHAGGGEMLSGMMP